MLCLGVLDGRVRALQIFLAAAVPEKYGAKRIEQTVPGGVAPGSTLTAWMDQRADSPDWCRDKEESATSSCAIKNCRGVSDLSSQQRIRIPLDLQQR